MPLNGEGIVFSPTIVILVQDIPMDGRERIWVAVTVDPVRCTRPVQDESTPVIFKYSTAYYLK